MCNEWLENIWKIDLTCQFYRYILFLETASPCLPCSPIGLIIRIVSQVDGRFLEYIKKFINFMINCF